MNRPGSDYVVNQWGLRAGSMAAALLGTAVGSRFQVTTSAEEVFEGDLFCYDDRLDLAVFHIQPHLPSRSRAAPCCLALAAPLAPPARHPTRRGQSRTAIQQRLSLLARTCLGVRSKAGPTVPLSRLSPLLAAGCHARAARWSLAVSARQAPEPSTY
jgi:hypothetical protein